jgi:NAD(P)H dehydrogenase (quinone)
MRDFTMKKIAITAASGQLGRAILNQLKLMLGVQYTPYGPVEGSEDDTSRLVAVARDPHKLADCDVEVRAGDYADIAAMEVAFAGVDTVVFISSPAGVANREELHRNVINAAVAAGVRKMIYTSVIGNGDEMNTWYAPMAQVNRQAEADLAASGLTWIAARNGLYLEFDVAHIVNAKDAGVFRNNGGEGYCAYITRSELAVAYAHLAVHERCDNSVVNVVGDAYTQSELVEMVNAQAGISVRYEMSSDEECLAKLAPQRGREVAAMLTGCYQAIRNGAFDVESDFEMITHVACKPIQLQIAEVLAGIRAAS